MISTLTSTIVLFITVLAVACGVNAADEAKQQEPDPFRQHRFRCGERQDAD